MGLLTEFKEFAQKGNVVDLATAVIVGGAFGKITSSLVNDVIMPPIGLLLGGVEFYNLKLILQDAKDAVMEGDVEVQAAIAEVTINYGNFLQTVVDFLIIAFAIFMMIRTYKKLSEKPAPAPAAPAPPPPPSEEIVLLREIRDALKK